eukprot:TRINITY_DN1850_c0_g1_i3.p1 TRINITY_DN1850_c0_g1~~TRINITY_DN1850_c0_g1_i3.p1  ORF type:complete len:1163 (+),score=446.41 TRINITY_DN1850_c0_g1_i3:28-3516(+)
MKGIRQSIIKDDGKQSDDLRVLALRRNAQAQPTTPQPQSQLQMKTPFKTKAMDEEREPMKVMLRLRPLSTREVQNGDQNCIHISEDDSAAGTVTVQPPSGHRNVDSSSLSFSFTRVFPAPSTQTTLFDAAGLQQVHALLAGTSGLLFAYGITNAGKTYTILGGHQQPGIIPRTIEALFQYLGGANGVPCKPSKLDRLSILSAQSGKSRASICDSELELSGSEFDLSSIGSEEVLEPSLPPLPTQLDPNSEYTVMLSYFEIYNECIYDLLAEDTDTTSAPNTAGSKTRAGVKVLPSFIPAEREKLQLREDRQGHFFVQGLREVKIETPQQAQELLVLGMKNRQVNDNTLHKDSSRSHCITTFRLIKRPKGVSLDLLKDNPSLFRISKLSIVDLAGSERANRTQNTGARLREANNINTSLLVFGRCIEILRYNQTHVNQKAVPSRESKLTMIFNDFFTGVGKAVMIVNANPATCDFDETLQVLRFSAMARDITIASRVDTRSAIKRRRDDTRRTGLFEEVEESTVDNEAEKASETEAQKREIMFMKAYLSTTAQVEKLKAEVERLTKLLEQSDAAKSELEIAVRQEAVEEMQQIMEEANQRTEERSNQALCDMEEKYLQRIRRLVNEAKEREDEDEQELSSLRRKISELQGKLNDIQNSSSGEIASLKGKLAIAAKQIKEKTDQDDGSLIELKEKVLKLQADLRERDRLVRASGKESEMSAELQKAVRELEKDNRALVARNEELRRAEASQTFTWEQRYSELLAMRDTLQKRVNEYEEEIEEYRESCKDLEQKEKLLRSKLESEVRNATKQLVLQHEVEIEKLNAQHRSKVDELTAEIKSLEEANSTLEERLEEMAHQIVQDPRTVTGDKVASHLLDKKGKGACHKLLKMLTPTKKAPEMGSPVVMMSEEMSKSQNVKSTSLWKGGAAPSPSGSGVSVTFHTVDVINTKPVDPSTTTTTTSAQAPEQASTKLKRTYSRKARAPLATELMVPSDSSLAQAFLNPDIKRAQQIAMEYQDNEDISPNLQKKAIEMANEDHSTEISALIANANKSFPKKRRITEEFAVGVEGDEIEDVEMEHEVVNSKSDKKEKEKEKEKEKKEKKEKKFWPFGGKKKEDTEEITPSKETKRPMGYLLYGTPEGKHNSPAKQQTESRSPLRTRTTTKK